MDKGAKNESWRDWCGQNHTHIKAPIDGWNGVKSGIIRIDKERTPFKEWLSGLKDERWPQAWETFWKNERFLQNVGF
jgi:hypothetical protein